MNDKDHLVGQLTREKRTFSCRLENKMFVSQGCLEVVTKHRNTGMPYVNSCEHLKSVRFSKNPFDEPECEPVD